jgi:TPR repeat protein
LGTDDWVLTARELGGAAIRAPRGFVGAIDLAIELRLGDDTVADRLSLHLTWPEAPKTAMAIEAAQTPAVAAAVGTGSTGGPLRQTPNPQATTVPLRRLDRDEIADLRKRGEEFMAAGNLGLARLALQRAAEAGDPQAAFALATTYDPLLLEARRVIGVVPDIAVARAWYEKAKELGSTDAPLRVKPFASRDR